MKTKIIYEDEALLVIHKPAGVATQTAKIGQADVVSEMKNYLMSGNKAEKDAKSINKGQGSSNGRDRNAAYLGVIHRLDQPVEGLLVFAKTKDAAAKLTAQLAQGILNKQYYAVICGQPVAEQGELVDYMYKDANSRAQVVTGAQDKYPEAKKATLQYHLVRSVSTAETVHISNEMTSAKAGDNKSTMDEISLMDIHIDTGRFHQIRAQMAHAGMALLGDTKYADEFTIQKSRELGVRNVALCAYKIEFTHPITNQKHSYAMEPEGKAFSLFFHP